VLCQEEELQLTDFLPEVGVLVVGDDEAEAEPVPAVALAEVSALFVTIVMLLVLEG